MSRKSLLSSKLLTSKDEKMTMQRNVYLNNGMQKSSERVSKQSFSPNRQERGQSSMSKQQRQSDDQESNENVSEQQINDVSSMDFASDA